MEMSPSLTDFNLALESVQSAGTEFLRALHVLTSQVSRGKTSVATCAASLMLVHERTATEITQSEKVPLPSAYLDAFAGSSDTAGLIAHLNTL